jgi:beta-mannosidase
MPIHNLACLSWQFAATARRGWADPLDDPQRLPEWLPARVPGTVQRDLMAAGRLPDLTAVLDLEAALAEVDAQDWWYRAELPAAEPGQRLWLCFAGIDYFAAVTVNGVELGRRAGMFAPREWEVTPWLQNGPATLAVRLWGGGSLPHWPRSRRWRLARWLLRRLQNGPPAFDDRLLSLKAPVHYGWDFAPRLLAVGIWDDVLLHTAVGVGIREVWARATWGPEYGLMLHLELDADRTRTVTLVASLCPVHVADEGEQSAVWSFPVPAGYSRRSVPWVQARLRPWATHDRGFPHLYRLRLELRDEHGRLLDVRETRVGARTIGWEGGAGSMVPLVLNGERLFWRGINWVPLDLLRGGEDDEARYRHLLGQARAAGVNAVRVWGGGGRERRFFYDLCDELGLLVWQEMPIACVFFDRLPRDRAFLALAQQEARGIIRTLRGHPSVFVWCGGNEWGPRRHRRLAATLSRVAAAEDPGRRWLPASPGPGDSHNWQVWHGKASPVAYVRDPAPLLSEFGLAAPPDRDHLARLLPPEALWPPGPAWQQRQAEPDKLWHYARLVNPALSVLSPPDAFVAASQQAQARGLQVGIEAYRLREGAVGCFLWQWNEPWPAISWSIFPYRGPAKAAYGQIVRSYAPLAPLARVVKGTIELWLVNDGFQSPGSCRFHACLDGKPIWEGEVIPPVNGRMRVAVLPRADGRLLTLHLRGPGLDLHNDYLLDLWPARSPVSPFARLRQRVKAYLLRW